jgi:hypothetical protein
MAGFVFLSVPEKRVLGDIGKCASGEASAQIATAYPDPAKMRYARDFLGLDYMGAFGLHFAHCKCAGLAVARADGVNHDSDLFVPLEKSERSSQHGVLSVCTDKDKLAGPKLGEQSFNSRLIERVDAALVQDYLVVILQKVVRQIVMAVSGETYPPPQKCVVNLPLSLGSVKTIVSSAAAVAIGIDLAGRDDGDIVVPGPGQHPSKIGQDPAMVSDTGLPFGEEKVSLCAYVNQYSSSARFYQLPNHLLLSSLHYLRNGLIHPMNITYYQRYSSGIFIGERIPAL